MIKKIFFVLVVSFIALYNLSIIYIDKNISQKKDKSLYAGCHKVWSSRGLYEIKAQQNSILSFQRAFSHGAQGAEVDFYYDVKSDRFIISHKKPKKDQNGTLVYTQKNGKILTLEELLQTFEKGYYFWLDYKNLDRISDAETTQAIKRLLSITQENNLRERLFIEGSNPLRLSDYTEAGFKTLLAVRPLPQDNILASISANLFKIGYYFSNVTALAIPYGEIQNPFYGQKSQEALHEVPVFLFHIPDDENLLYSLVKKEQVRVMLVGRDESKDRFYIDNCK